MSAELIATLSAFITLGFGMVASAAWMIRRIDTSTESLRTDLGGRIDKVDSRIDKVDARIDKVDARIDKVDSRLDKLDDRLEGLGREITDVKVSVARWEGPRPHLLTAK